ncbi:putative nucleotidyltransferase [Paenarthrobacter nicotinovorans]|nr:MULTISPECIES: hypothetical protein [Micrococcaceae]MDR6435375.1 putative nucleotidyltransferase [Paenarthrobacter nicotinovorans]SCZ49568.1 Predicted nucleotidyltransferase [Arthrobacter sp. UNCCL28]
MFTSKRNLNFSGYAAAHFDPLGLVLESIIQQTDVTTDDFMVVGAEARNLLHRSFGKDPVKLSTTSDIDVALTMQSWAGIENLSTTYELLDSSKSAIRFRVENVPVDVIPFGVLEQPSGVVQTPKGDQEINVLGYRTAFKASEWFILPKVGAVRVVDPSFYVVLKLEALADRSKWYKTKDAEDIGTALTWLVPTATDETHIYDHEFDLLAAYGHDMSKTLTELFGRHLASVLEFQEHARLMDKVHGLDVDRFVNDLHRGLFPEMLIDRRSEAVDRFSALTKGLGY